MLRSGVSSSACVIEIGLSRNMEDLIHEWKRFTLVDDEKERITLNKEDALVIGSQASQSLVGKLISNRFISKTALKNSMVGAWKTRHDFNIDIIGSNIFLFIFENRDDREWILRNGPWFFDRCLLVIEAPKKNQRTMDLTFKYVDF